MRRRCSPFRSVRAIRPNRRVGFTLIEVIAAIAVLAALGAVASSTVLAALNSYLSAATRAQLHTEASLALDRITRELQSTALDPAASAVAPQISAMSTTTISWNDADNLVLSGGTLLFTDDGGPAAPILTDVTAFSLQAYNENNAAMAASLTGAACQPIRRIGISITVQRAGVSETLRTKIFLRCTMEGS